MYLISGQSAARFIGTRFRSSSVLPGEPAADSHFTHGLSDDLIGCDHRPFVRTEKLPRFSSMFSFSQGASERTWIQAVSSRLRVDVGPVSEKLLVAALCSFILSPILIISTK